MLVYAIISMTCALLFYTIGVWSERKIGELKWGHIIFFTLGFCCDFTGTTLMKSLINPDISHFRAELHIITGTLALILMFVHLVWALFVIVKGNETYKVKFHKFSVVVWSFWLIPYIIGMIIGMTTK